MGGAAATLTAREREVLELVLSGHSSKVIAAKLGVSERAVVFHRQNIRRKFGGLNFPAIAKRLTAT